MSFNITNFDINSVTDTVKSTLEDSSVASNLGIQGTGQNIRQFYNRMGTGPTYTADKSIYNIAYKHYFDIEFNFKPDYSNVSKILQNSLVESNNEALKFLVQGIEIPDIGTNESVDDLMTELGGSILPGLTTVPDDQVFTIEFLSTEFSLHEHAMYYWLRETTSNEWMYDVRPYSKCDMTIQLLDNKSGSPIYGYKLYNAYPIKIETVNVHHSFDDTMTRTVAFAFDVMSVIPSKIITSDVLNDVFDRYVGSKVKEKVRSKSSKLSNKFADKIFF